MRRACLLLMVSLAATPVAAADSAPARLRAFLDAHGNQSGLPQGRDVAAIRRFSSHALETAMDDAKEHQIRFIAANPDEKPPFIEGPLFNSSGYEPFTAYALVLPDGGCGADRSTIRVDFVDTAASPDVLWHDDFVMVREPRRGWVLDDVHYRAGFAYGNHGSLRANLAAAGDD